MNADLTPFDLENTYVSFVGGGKAFSHLGGAAFWHALATGAGIPREISDADARMASLFHVDKDWSNWEVHPAGEELVYVLAGEIDMVFEFDGGSRTVRLKERMGVLVPRGVWHTSNVVVPAQVLHITPGTGTRHRDR